MKQVLLRMPDQLHKRLVARAKREHRSVNSIANQILDAMVNTEELGRRERLHAAAAATDLLQSTSSKRISPARRKRILESTHGLRISADRLISYERDRF